MALDSFVRLIGDLAAKKPMSLYQVAARHNWNREDVEKLLRCERRPTEKMLKDIAKEFDDDLRSLARFVGEVEKDDLGLTARDIQAI